MRAIGSPAVFRVPGARPTGRSMARAFGFAPPRVERVFAANRALVRPRPAPAGLPRSAFVLLLAGMVMRICVGPGMLYLVHVNYAAEGGNPLFKIHPGTYVLALAMWLWLAQGGAPLRRLATHYYRQRLLFAFVAMMLACLAYSVVNRLAGYLSIFADTFLAAGIVGSLLSAASARQRAATGEVLLWVLCLNAAVAVGETVLHRHLIPEVPFDGLVAIPLPGDFRGSGLSTSSLEGAMVTMIGMLLLFRLRLPVRRLGWRFAVLALGLVAFGGRTPLVVTATVLLLAGAIYLLRELAMRRLRAEAIGAALIVGTVLPFITLVLITSTPIGARIYNTFYFDNSADVRVVAWHIFSVLPTRNLVLGTPDPLTMQLAAEIGIPVPYADLENCWLVLIVSLGLVGFTLFMIGFIPFVLLLWRRAGQGSGRESAAWGRIVLAAFFIVASTNNSFGRKGPLLVVLVAALFAAAPLPRLRRISARRPLPALRRAVPAAASVRNSDRLERREPVFRRPRPFL